MLSEEDKAYLRNTKLYIKRIDGTFQLVAEFLEEYDLGKPNYYLVGEIESALDAVLSYNRDNYEPSGDSPYPGIR